MFRSEARSSRWRLVIWGVAALILLLPFVAMQATDGVEWDVADFVIFGAMLVGAAATCDAAFRMSADRAYRAAVGVALAAAFLLIWINLAVGIIGGEGNPANWLHAGVLAVAVGGTMIARRQPIGMSRALCATALAQLLVAALALTAGWGSAGHLWPADILLGTAFFAALWLLSAWLFRKAGAGPSA